MVRRFVEKEDMGVLHRQLRKDDTENIYFSFD